jgi:hypothetical protein
MRRRFVLCAAVGILLVAAPTASAGTGDGPPPDQFIDESKLPFDPIPGPVFRD